jgi:hypothetical protein
VLLAVEEALANATDLPLILHTCQFFTDVMLQDFPAEVFLHRPAVLKVLINVNGLAVVQTCLEQALAKWSCCVSDVPGLAG